MQPLANPAYGLWVQLILALAVAAGAIVLGCALCAAVAHGARWKRTVWQASTVGLLLLILLELSGTGRGLVAVCRLAASETAEGETAAATQPREENDAARFSLAEETTSPQIDRPEALCDGPAPESQRSFPPPPWEPEDVAAADPPFLSAAAPTDLDLDDPDVASAALPIPPSPVEESPVVAPPEGPLPSANLEDPIQQQAVEPPPVAPAKTAPSIEPQTEQPRPVAPAVFNAAWLGVVWAVVAASLIAWAIWTRIRLWWFRRRQGLPAGPELVRRATRLARRMGMRRPLALIEARGLKTPVAFGTMRPTIALPIGFAEDFDRPQQDAMLAHELAHLAARDPLWHSLATVACGLLWWHPLVWWSRRRFRAAGETLADEASLLVPDGPNALARCLVRLGQRLARPNPVGSLPIEGSGFRSGLGRRVVRLLSLRPDAWRGAWPCRSFALKTLLPVLLVIVAVLCTAWVRPQAALAEGGTPMDVLKTSWRSSLATMALVALIGPAGKPAPADDAAGTLNPAATADVLALAQDRDVPREADRDVPRDRERREGDREGARDRDVPRDRDVREREGDRPRDRAEGERREGDQPRDKAEGERREGERPREKAEGERREGERPREKAEGERREGDRPREKAEGERREGERPRERAEGEAERPREREGERAERPEREGAEQRERAERREMEAREQAERREMVERQRAEARERAEAERREMEARQRAEMERNRERMMVQARIQELLKMNEQLQAHALEIRRQLMRGELGAEDRQHLQQELAQVSERTAQVQRELAEVRERAERPPERPQPPGGPEDIERRMQHLRVAAENLHAAGLHDQAEKLMREAEDIARALHERPGEPRGPQPPRPPERPEGPPPIEQMQRQIDELRGAVEDMHRQMEEMRRQLQELVELQRQRKR